MYNSVRQGSECVIVRGELGSYKQQHVPGHLIRCQWNQVHGVLSQRNREFSLKVFRKCMQSDQHKHVRKHCQNRSLPLHCTGFKYIETASLTVFLNTCAFKQARIHSSTINLNQLNQVVYSVWWLFYDLWGFSSMIFLGKARSYGADWNNSVKYKVDADKEMSWFIIYENPSITQL